MKRATRQVLFDDSEISLGSATVSGTPQALLGTITDLKWTLATFRVLGDPAVGDWVLTLGTDTYTYGVVAEDGIADLTLGLADQIGSQYKPLVSGYTVTFATPWPTFDYSTVTLADAPVVEDIWTVRELRRHDGRLQPHGPHGRNGRGHGARAGAEGEFGSDPEPQGFGRRQPAHHH
jgi:hypothetical protein